MTQEEKAKAYDEALKVLHKYDGANIMFSQSLKEEMFPELKESEDEKTRKEMIFYFQEEIPLCSIQEHADKMKEFVAWLEKQGKPVNEEKVLIGARKDVALSIMNFLDRNTLMKVFNNMIRKPGEQNPAWSEDDEEILKVVIKSCEQCGNGYTYYWLKSLKDRVQLQPKQEWSEEDEEALEEVQINFEINKGKMTPALQECYDRFFDKIKTLNPYLKKEWSEEDKEFINDLIGIFDGQQYQAHSDEEIVKWLKSIRLPYKKEWDEKDEEMLRSIIATCELACEDRTSSPGEHLLGMQIVWLKSLRPQNTWKPSDEQLKSLQEVINVGHFTSYPNSLETLYEQLKKLKEE